jgi:hypothetical protein
LGSSSLGRSTMPELGSKTMKTTATKKAAAAVDVLPAC